MGVSCVAQLVPLLFVVNLGGVVMARAAVVVVVFVECTGESSRGDWANGRDGTAEAVESTDV